MIIRVWNWHGLLVPVLVAYSICSYCSCERTLIKEELNKILNTARNKPVISSVIDADDGLFLLIIQEIIVYH